MSDILLIPAHPNDEEATAPISEVTHLIDAATTVALPFSLDRVMWIEGGTRPNIRAMALAACAKVCAPSTSERPVVGGRVYITGGTPQHPQPLSDVQGFMTVVQLTRAYDLLHNLLGDLMD